MLMLPLLVSSMLLSSSEQPPTTSGGDPRAVLDRSLLYVQNRGLWWIAEKKCVTCHRVGNMLWTLTAAREGGLAVDPRLDEWFDWAIATSRSANSQGRVDGSVNKEGVAQLLLAGRQFAGTSPERTAAIAELATLLASLQAEDGSWTADGQLPRQKRPAAETRLVSTMWITLALLDHRDLPSVRPAIERAWPLIVASRGGDSTEWYAVRLLLAARLENSAAVATFTTELLERRQSDGGWGWLTADPSDALGTGMAIYALLATGTARDAPPVQQALAFLAGTQRDDGSWAVHGTKDNKRDSVEETAVYWGTSWAALALSQSLGSE